jgi:hypothetical protein
MVTYFIRNGKYIILFADTFLTKVNLELSPREEIAVLVPSLNMIPNIVKTFSNVFVVNNKKHKYNNMLM